MARTRNIKPSFFSNDDLAELSAYARLLFIGMWTLADKSGRLEDKPKRIKAILFPYEEIDCHELAAKLHGKKFITRYEVNGIPYIQINNFSKHQNPHPKEQPSIIPEPAEICEAVELNDKPRKGNGKPILTSFPSSSNPSSNPLGRVAAQKPSKLEKPENISQEVWNDFIRQRKTKFTQTALDGIEREVAKAGIGLEEGLRMAVERGWQSFKADWVSKESKNGKSTDIKQQTNQLLDELRRGNLG